MWVVYAAIGVVTLSAFVPTIIWAASDSNNLNTIIEKDAELILEKDVRIEYIENEEFDSTGITFKYEKKTIGCEELTNINYDFSISGTRVVEFVKEIGKKVYTAYLPVKVYHVRHISVEDPTVIRNEDDTWDTSKVRVYADLNEVSSSFTKPEGTTSDQTLVELTNKQFSVEVEPDADMVGRYVATVTSGKASTTFKHFEELEFNHERVLPLINASGTQDKLTLFVESNDNGYIFPDGTNTFNVTGTYVFEDVDHNLKQHQFLYTQEGWNCNFRSGIDGYGSDADPQGFTCIFNGIKFFAAASTWHDAILGNGEAPMPEPVNPDPDAPDVAPDRILPLVNQSGGTETLNLYVEYSSNNFIFPSSPTHVVCYGTYIFTNAGGTKFSYPFLYHLNGWSSEFRSGFDSYDSATEGFKAVINGITFFADANSWHGAIIGKTSGEYPAKDIIVPNITGDRHLSFTNSTGNGNTLDLYVTYNSENFVYPDGTKEIKARGVYIFTQTNGNKTALPFEYRFNNWTNEFNSGFDSYDSATEGLKAVVNETTFFADATSWHLAILGQE